MRQGQNHATPPLQPQTAGASLFTTLPDRSLSWNLYSDKASLEHSGCSISLKAQPLSPKTSLGFCSWNLWAQFCFLSRLWLMKHRMFFKREHWAGSRNNAGGNDESRMNGFWKSVTTGPSLQKEKKVRISVWPNVLPSCLKMISEDTDHHALLPFTVSHVPN